MHNFIETKTFDIGNVYLHANFESKTKSWVELEWCSGGQALNS